MPVPKVPVGCLVRPKTHDLFKQLAEKRDISMSQLGGRLIEREINEAIASGELRTSQ